MLKKAYYLSVLLFFISQFSDAQSFYNKGRNRKLVANGGFGVASYYGDLNNPGDIIDFTPDITFGARYEINNMVSVGMNLAWFMLRGDDAEADTEGRERRNLSFRSHNVELSVLGFIDLYPRGKRFYQRPIVGPYAYFGIGLLYYNPQAELEGSYYSLRPLQTEGNSYSIFTPTIPLGFGLRFRATPFINVVLEGGYRITFTDYLDDVSTVYIDNSTFDDPIARQLADRRPEIGLPLKEAGSVRGNPEKNDGYFITSLKVEIYLPDILFEPNPYRGRGFRRRR